MNFDRLDLSFTVKGDKCAGWLYLPEGVEKPPVVIMAHGLAAIRTFRLDAFAEKFVERGLAAFVFDYRNFGDSEGEPRHLINPWRQLEDWKAAIEYVRGLQQVNPDKIALWGTSCSGGHVIATAAKVSGISAVVSQIPNMDSLSPFLSFGFRNIIKGIIFGLRDLFRKLTGRERYHVKVFGTPDELALLNKHDSKAGYESIIPPISYFLYKSSPVFFFTFSLSSLILSSLITSPIASSMERC